MINYLEFEDIKFLDSNGIDLIDENGEPTIFCKNRLFYINSILSKNFSYVSISDLKNHSIECFKLYLEDYVNNQSSLEYPNLSKIMSEMSFLFTNSSSDDFSTTIKLPLDEIGFCND